MLHWTFAFAKSVGAPSHDALSSLAFPDIIDISPSEITPEGQPAELVLTPLRGSLGYAARARLAGTDRPTSLDALITSSPQEVLLQRSNPLTCLGNLFTTQGAAYLAQLGNGRSKPVCNPCGGIGPAFAERALQFSIEN
jgi:hypothetical protein